VTVGSTARRLNLLPKTTTTSLVKLFDSVADVLPVRVLLTLEEAAIHGLLFLLLDNVSRWVMPSLPMPSYSHSSTLSQTASRSSSSMSSRMRSCSLVDAIIDKLPLTRC
jgi:hypothetical protein